MQTIGYIALAFACWHVLTQLPAWWRVCQVYGYLPVSLASQMLAYALRSPAGHILRWLKIAVIVWLGGEFLYSHGWVPVPPRLLFVAILIWLANGLLAHSLPPSVLFLAGSSPDAAIDFSRLCKALWPYRTVSLLRPAQDWNDPESRGWFLMGCLRTGHIYEWRTEVFHLMDVVPLIVIDKRNGTENVKEEWRRIVEKGYLDRTLQLEGSPDAEWPKAVRARLQGVSDQAERRQRQAEFTRQVGMLPPHIRFDRSLYSLVVRSRRLEQDEFERYLRRCKRITQRQLGQRLPEDVPSAVSREEEERFLRDSRAYEEVGILLRSALESVEGPVEASTAYNIGNCLNNLGKLARRQQRWDDAVDYLKRALSHFERVPPAPDMLAERATTYYLLGEIHAARFRVMGSEADRERAMDYLDLCLRLDGSVGADGREARVLLQAIQEPPAPLAADEAIDAHLLSEPRVWENPTIAQIISLVVVAACMIPCAMATGWLMGLPPGWLSEEGWDQLSSGQVVLVGIGT